MRSAFGDNYDPLTQVKAAYDSHNFFCRNQNIAPVGAGVAASADS